MSTPTLSIATWNLERSGAHHRCRMPGQVDRMREHASDIWILTETHDDIAPPDCPYSVRSEANPQWQAPGERLVSIWSRFPMSPVRTTDQACTAAASLRPPDFDRPLLVCGSVVSCECVSELRQRGSAASVAAVGTRISEWKSLAARHPGHDLCFVLDFNVAHDDANDISAPVAHKALLNGLMEVRLRCLNIEDLDYGRAGVRFGGVSGICYSDLRGLSLELTSWSGGSGSSRLSDHNGLRMDLARL